MQTWLFVAAGGAIGAAGGRQGLGDGAHDRAVPEQEPSEGEQEEAGQKRGGEEIHENDGEVLLGPVRRRRARIPEGWRTSCWELTLLYSA